VVMAHHQRGSGVGFPFALAYARAAAPFGKQRRLFCAWGGCGLVVVGKSSLLYNGRDECTRHPDGTNDVTAEVIDSQERDEASHDFKKTVHLSLEGLTCRPATVTLRAGPRTYITVRVPAVPCVPQQLRQRPGVYRSSRIV
jgi:hypothetical protein